MCFFLTSVGEEKKAIRMETAWSLEATTILKQSFILNILSCGFYFAVVIECLYVVVFSFTLSVVLLVSHARRVCFLYNISE